MQCSGALRRPLRDIIKSIGNNVDQHAYPHGQLPRAYHHGLLRPDSERHQATSQGRAAAGLSRNVSHARHTSRDPGQAWRLPQSLQPMPRSTAARSASNTVTAERETAASTGAQSLQEDGVQALCSDEGGSRQGQREHEVHSSRNSSYEQASGGDRDPQLASQEPAEGRRSLQTDVEPEQEAQIGRDVEVGLSRDDEFVPDENFAEDNDSDSGADGADVHVESAPQYQPLVAGLASEHDQPDALQLQGTVQEVEGNLSDNYFDAARTIAENRSSRLLRGYQRQKDRHPNSSMDWRPIFAMLDRHTPSGKGLHERIIETVRLPPHAVAMFKGQASTSILEIMQRTYCHIQIGKVVEADETADSASERDEPTFSSLTLLGTKLENSAALEILPNYLRILPTKGGRVGAVLTDLIFNREIEKGDSFRKPGKRLLPHQSAQEDLSSSENDDLEHEINLLTGSSPKPAVPLRSIWAKVRTGEREDPAKFLKRPQLKTALALTAYVEDITAAIPALVKRKLRGVPEKNSTYGTHHVGRVTAELLSLVSDPDLVRLVSSRAIDRIAQYWDRNRDTKSFRKMFAALEENGYVFTTNNYNVALGVAARAGDVHNFRYVLALMLRRGQLPNATTWARFHELMCVRFPFHAGIVTERMRARSFLADFRATHDVVRHSVPLHLRAHLDKGGSLAHFSKLYDNKFGVSYGLKEFNWLLPDVASEMVYVLVSAGRLSEAFDVLDEMWSRDEKALLNIYVLNAFLRSALRAGDPHAAMIYLRRFRVGEQGSLLPGAATYVALFDLAWNCQCYNMLRVIWRYACAAGHSLRTMRARILGSATSLPPEAIDGGLVHEQLWRFWAGKFAINVNDGLPQPSGKFRRLLKTHPRPSADDDLPIRRVDPYPGTDTAWTGAATTFSKATKAAEEEQPWEPHVVRLSLTEAERAIIRHQCELPQTEDERKARSGEYLKIFLQDLDEVMNCHPTRPLYKILEDAWRMDVQWAKRDPEANASEVDHGTFAEMMVQGILVPMKVGNFASEKRAWEVPWKKNQVDKAAVKKEAVKSTPVEKA